MKTKNYGATFKVARFALGLNQEGLAKALGVSQSKISKIEDDKLEPSASDIIWLADRVLKVNLAMSLEAALQPAAQKLEVMAVKRAHRRGDHKDEPHPKCGKCQDALS